MRIFSLTDFTVNTIVSVAPVVWGWAEINSVKRPSLVMGIKACFSTFVQKFQQGGASDHDSFLNDWQ